MPANRTGAPPAMIPGATFSAALAGTGLTYSGGSFSLAATAAGAGLTHTAGVLDVVAGTGISVAADSVGLDLTATLAWTGAHTFGAAGIAATSTPRVVASNTTAATVGAPAQWSPSIDWTGQAWDVDGAVSTTSRFYVENQTNANNDPYGQWRLYHKLGAAAAVLQIDVDSRGWMNANGGLIQLATKKLAEDGGTTVNLVEGFTTASLRADLSMNTGKNVLLNANYMQLGEMTPPAGATDVARLYADVSTGKTRLMVIFQSGSAIQIAAEA